MTQSAGLASFHDPAPMPAHMGLRTKANTYRHHAPLAVDRERLRDRIPTMGYDEMLRLCRANALHFKEQARNQGLLVMRARNALYYALRENLPLVETD